MPGIRKILLLLAAAMALSSCGSSAAETGGAGRRTQAAGTAATMTATEYLAALTEATAEAPTGPPTEAPAETPTGPPTEALAMETDELPAEGLEEPAETEEPVETEPPRLPLSGAVIGIDAGHQAKGNASQEAVFPGSGETKAKVSSGTRGVSTGIYEYELNLAVALLLEQYLNELGAEVIMSRTVNDVNISNSERATMMNEAGADLCLRIHANGSENASVNGALMLTPGSLHTEQIQESSLLASEIIFESFLRETGAADGGIITRDDLTGFNWSTVPVCLIEMGYMSNPEEDILLSDTTYREKCARGLADGIAAWYALISEYS